MSHDSNSTGTADDSTDKLSDVSRRTFLGATGAAALGGALGVSSETVSASSTRTWNVHDWKNQHGVSTDYALSQIISRADDGDTILFPAVGGETWYTVDDTHEIHKSLTLKGEDGAYIERTGQWCGFFFKGPGLTGDVASMTGSVSLGDSTIPVDTGAVNFDVGDYVHIRNQEYYPSGADGGTHEYPVQFAEVTGVSNGAIEISNEAYFDYSPANGQVEKVEMLEGPVVDNITMVGDNNDPSTNYMSDRGKTRGMFQMRWVKGGVYRDSSIRNYFSNGFYFFDCWDVVWDHVEAYDAQSKASGKGEGIKAGQTTGVKALSIVHKNCRRGIDFGQGTSEMLVKDPQIENASLVGIGHHYNTDSYVAGRMRIEGGTVNAAGTAIDHVNGQTIVDGTTVKTSGNGLGIAGDNFKSKDVTIEGIDGGTGYGVFINRSPSNVAVHGEIIDNTSTFENAAVTITPDGDVSNLLFDLDITSSHRFYCIDMSANSYKDIAIRGTLNSNSSNSDIAIQGTYHDAGVIDGLDVSVDLKNHGGPGMYLLRGDRAERVRIHDTSFDIDGDYGIWFGYDLGEQRQTEIENVSIRGANVHGAYLESNGSAYVSNLDGDLRTVSGVDLVDSDFGYTIDVDAPLVGDSSSSALSTSSTSSSSSSSSSGDLSGQRHGMSVAGTGNETEYTFTVSGSVDPRDNVETGDSVSGSTVTGTTKWKSDNYDYTGDITSFDVVSGDEDISIWIDGSKYSPSDFPSSSGSSGSSGGTNSGATHKIEIQGTGAEVRYTFDVSGQIEWSDSVESNDDIGVTSVEGQISIADDTFGYSGELKSFDVVDGTFDDVKVYVDGERQFPGDLGGEWHTLQIQGTGPVTRYTFDTSGQVDPKGTLEDSDSLHSTSADGQVSTGSDTYSYAGSLESFAVTYGDASDIAVYVDGNRRSIGDSSSSSTDSSSSGSTTKTATNTGTTREMSVTGTGNETKYRFTVSGSIDPGDNVESADDVSDSAATGTVQWLSDNYTITGDITSFEVLSGDEDIDIWLAGDKYSPSDFASSSDSSSTDSSPSGSSTDGGSSTSSTSSAADTGSSRGMSVTGTGNETRYTFTVSGSVDPGDNVESADDVSESKVTGSVQWMSDNYTITGDITSFEVVSGDEDITIWLAGDKYSPSDFASSSDSSSTDSSSSDGSKLIKVSNTGSSGAAYEFGVSGTVEAYESTGNGDWADGDSAGGKISPDDYDTYTFTGTLDWFDVYEGDDQDVQVAISTAGSS